MNGLEECNSKAWSNLKKIDQTELVFRNLEKD